MASGYMTSDGKDLDQRYLAINGKAATAGRADSAARADSVTGISGHLGTAVVISTQSKNATKISWTAPLDGYLNAYATNKSSGNVSVSAAIEISGIGRFVGNDSYTTSVIDCFSFVKSGTVVTGTYDRDRDAYLRCTLYPISHY